MSTSGMEFPETDLPLRYLRLMLLVWILGGAQAFAEVGQPETQSGDEAVAESVIKVSPLPGLLEQRGVLEAAIEETRENLKQASDDVSRDEFTRLLERQQQELASLGEQISALATGVPDSAFDLEASQQIDLQAEAEQLLQPFIIMLRSATEEARQIERLRRTADEGARLEKLAKGALNSLESQLATETDPKVLQELERLQDVWQQRAGAAEDLQASAARQLQQKETQKALDAADPGAAVTGFFVNRGLSLVMGIGSFLLVLGSLFALASLAGRWRKRRGYRRNFRVRLLFLIFMTLAMLLAIITMLAIFNMRNDWFLLGISVLLLLALSWFGIKLLPSLLEQLVTWLDLGAVQEGERLMFNGVPWRVEKLAWHTDLVNPALENGTFTLPIRELAGLHSRPGDVPEHWFPTEKGDWVLLEQGLGRVVFQSPEVVQIVLLGGIRHSFSAADFYAAPPPNLSQGSRVEVEFGIGYGHQDISTSEIPEKLEAFVHAGLLKLLEPQQLNHVAVETLAAGDSAINYEVEADITGDAAEKYEDVERALTRLCIEACNEFGWEIPFPQMVLHQPA